MITHKNQPQLLANLEVRENSYIFGPTGSGKSRAVKEAARELNLSFYKKLVGNQTSEVSILGYMDAGGRYVEGIAYKPFVEGGVLLIDEIDNGNPNTNLVINGLSDGEIAFPCGMREKHRDFCLVATANTVGNGATLEYCGRNRIDGALLNRFVFIKWPYDTELEKQIGLDEYKLHGGTDEEKFLLAHVEIQKFRQIIDELKIPHIISPRSTIQVARKLAKNRPIVEILQGILFKGMDQDGVAKIKAKAKDCKLLEQGVLQELDNLIVKLTPEEKTIFLKPIVDKALEVEREKLIKEMNSRQNIEERERQKRELTAIQTEYDRRLQEIQDKFNEVKKLTIDTVAGNPFDNIP